MPFYRLKYSDKGGWPLTRRDSFSVGFFIVYYDIFIHGLCVIGFGYIHPVALSPPFLAAHPSSYATLLLCASSLVFCNCLQTLKEKESL